MEGQLGGVRKRSGRTVGWCVRKRSGMTAGWCEEE